MKKFLKIAAMAFFLAPFFVLLHELAHVTALELMGVQAQLKGFAMGMPVFPPGFSWDFGSLRAAQEYYKAGDSAFVIGAIAGPIFTLLVGYIGFFALRRRAKHVFAVIPLSAIVPRMINVAFIPKFLNGTINTSDEAIAAYFMGWPLWSVFIVSMLLFYACFFLVMRTLPKGERFGVFLSTLIGGFIGFFAIEAVVNIYIFNFTTWTR